METQTVKSEGENGLYVNGGKLTTSLAQFRKTKHVDFSPGDTVRVHYKIKEGEKQRIQLYEGVVISIRGEGMSRSFMVRRVAHEVGVERVFPYHSPSIDKIEVTRRGRVRRAKLYYLRHKSGKAGRIREAFDTKHAREAKKNKKTAQKTEQKAAPPPAAAPEAEDAS